MNNPSSSACGAAVMLGITSPGARLIRFFDGNGTIARWQFRRP
jgi:hypothetical protein